MLRPSFVALALLAAASCRSVPEGPSEAETLVARSIAYHDPGGRWRNAQVAFTWTSIRPSGEVGMRFDVEQGASHFEMMGERGEHRLEYRARGGEIRARVDGSTEISDDVREAVGLTRDDGRLWRDYIGFLAGIPMCLNDPGVTISPGVERGELDGNPVDVVRVTFAPEVGTDRWTFYFEPETARVVGCRFDKENPDLDGETIVFSGESDVAGMRLPRAREWTMNSDGRFLGTEVVTALGDEPTDLLPPDVSAWGTELISLPPEFAPALPSGREALLFAPGMFDANADDYWSYAFVIELDEPLAPASLTEFLELYYDGLLSSVAGGKGADIGDDPATVTVTPSGDGFRASIDLIDAFVTLEPVALDVQLDLSEDGHTLRVQASPQPRSHLIWRSLAVAVATLDA